MCLHEHSHLHLLANLRIVHLNCPGMPLKVLDFQLPGTHTCSTMLVGYWGYLQYLVIKHPTAFKNEHRGIPSEPFQLAFIRIGLCTANSRKISLGFLSYS